jgi:hypothetical protein
MQWNKGLIIHCHGYRAEGIKLHAYLNPNDESYARLLSLGWMIAETSYRREGVIVRDAMHDVNNLQDYISDKFGPVNVTLLEGRSMGGCIVTLLAENFPHRYQGALAIGAALFVDQSKEVDPIYLNYRPLIPLLYLTNVSELSGPAQYTEKARKELENNDDAIVVPAQWQVDTEGHNSVNEEERYNAMIHVIEWARYQTFITCRNKNGTVLLDAQPSQAQFVTGPRERTGAIGKVTKFTIYGYVIVDFVASDLQKLGLRVGKRFDMCVLKHHKWVNVLWGTYPFLEANEGDWITSEEPNNGHFMFSQKTFKFVNPKGLLDVEIGDEIFIEEYQAPKPSKLNVKLNL